MSRWSFAASLPVLLFGLAAWLASAWLCYANWKRGGRRRATAWLEGLRFTLISLLAFTLLRPEFVRQLQRTESPEVQILTDASGSMKTRDVMLSNNVISRAEWLGRAQKTEFWKPLEKTAKVNFDEFSAPSANTNVAAGKIEEGTDLNRALETVLQRQKNLRPCCCSRTAIGTLANLPSAPPPVFAIRAFPSSPWVWVAKRRCRISL